MAIDMEEYGECAVCDNCVCDPYLAKQINRTGKDSACFYCHYDEQPTWPLSAVADAVETAFEQHFTRTSVQPDGLQSMMLADKEGSYPFPRRARLSRRFPRSHEDMRQAWHLVPGLSRQPPQNTRSTRYPLSARTRRTTLKFQNLSQLRYFRFLNESG